MNLLVVGDSKKLIRFIESLYPISNKCVIGWRSLPINFNELEKISSTEWDICLVAGYDYRSSGYSFDRYLASNVKNILFLVEKCLSKNSIIVYVNTMAASKKYTFSRYLFAKMLLAKELDEAFPKAVILEFPAIIESGKIAVKGGVLSQLAFKYLKHFGYLSTVVINQSSAQNANLFTQLSHKPVVPLPKLLKIPRPLILDRLMRLILG